MTNTFSRHLELEGIYNLRDIGGYPTQDGRTTRWQTVYRSDSLHNLSAEGQAALLATGLHTIIDLRRQDEIDAEPDVLMNSSEVSFYHMPVLPNPVSAGNSETFAAIKNAGELYCMVLDHLQDKLLPVFQQISDSIDKPVLVHCSAGKDRTGVVIAVLLDLANVAPETIATDYELTSVRIQPLLESYRQKAVAAGYNLEQHERMLECRAEWMLATVNHLHQRHGGARDYLRSIGMSQQAVDKLYSVLTVEG